MLTFILVLTVCLIVREVFAVTANITYGNKDTALVCVIDLIMYSPIYWFVFNVWNNGGKF
jgi:hypothetical protein